VKPTNQKPGAGADSGLTSINQKSVRRKINDSVNALNSLRKKNSETLTLKTEGTDASAGTKQLNPESFAERGRRDREGVGFIPKIAEEWGKARMQDIGRQ